jgi:hypothetical protein
MDTCHYRRNRRRTRAPKRLKQRLRQIGLFCRIRGARVTACWASVADHERAAEPQRGTRPCGLRCPVVLGPGGGASPGSQATDPRSGWMRTTGSCARSGFRSGSTCLAARPSSHSRSPAIALLWSGMTQKATSTARPVYFPAGRAGSARTWKDPNPRRRPYGGIDAAGASPLRSRHDVKVPNSRPRGLISGPGRPGTRGVRAAPDEV